MIEKTLCKPINKNKHDHQDDLEHKFEQQWQVRMADKYQDGEFPKGVAQPAVRALASIGVTRLEQLAGMCESDLIKLHGMGPKALGALKAAFAEKGLAFKDPGEKS